MWPVLCSLGRYARQRRNGRVENQNYVERPGHQQATRKENLAVNLREYLDVNLPEYLAVKLREYLDVNSQGNLDGSLQWNLRGFPS